MSSSAQILFDTAPLGVLVVYADGRPKPPARFRRKLQVWRRFNGVGRLDAKTPARFCGSHEVPATVTLYVGDFGAHGTVVLTVRMLFDVRSPLSFEVIDAAPGAFVCLTSDGVHLELDHVAAEERAASAWLDQPRADRSLAVEVLPDRTLRRLYPSLSAAAA